MVQRRVEVTSAVDEWRVEPDAPRLVRLSVTPPAIALTVTGIGYLMLTRQIDSCDGAGDRVLLGLSLAVDCTMLCASTLILTGVGSVVLRRASRTWYFSLQCAVAMVVLWLFIGYGFHQLDYSPAYDEGHQCEGGIPPWWPSFIPII